jgi:hypothetical protein
VRHIDKGQPRANNGHRELLKTAVFTVSGAGDGGRHRAVAVARGVCCAGGRQSPLGGVRRHLPRHRNLFVHGLLGLCGDWRRNARRYRFPEHAGCARTHRFVRNPMYIGVLLIVAGQAWLFWSRALCVYAALLWLAFHLFVMTYEEPTLRKQVGGVTSAIGPRCRDGFRNSGLSALVLASHLCVSAVTSNSSPQDQEWIPLSGRNLRPPPRQGSRLAGA